MPRELCDGAEGIVPNGPVGEAEVRTDEEAPLAELIGIPGGSVDCTGIVVDDGIPPERVLMTPD